MRRGLLIVLIVALLSGWISHLQRASGSRTAAAQWVRTRDGWENRAAIEIRLDHSTPQLHPATVAGLQLSASLLVLLAFPAAAIQQAGSRR